MTYTVYADGDEIGSELELSDVLSKIENSLNEDPCFLIQIEPEEDEEEEEEIED